MAQRKALMVALFTGMAIIVISVDGRVAGNPSDVRFSFEDRIRRMQEELKASSSVSPATSPSPSAQPGNSSPRVYRATSYGADPTGQTDSTEALLAALSDALRGPSNGFLMDGIANFGGARISLDGGSYLISRPLRFPSAGAGNLVIHGGTLRASDDFPTDGYLIDLTAPASTASSSYNYEYITFRDLMLDSNYRGGGILVQDSLRTSIDNCYIARFSTEGISVHGGHETYIRNSFLGQHITAVGDHGERNFSGTAINLSGNDNAVTDVVIFSASVGIMISGPANTISGVHCYNKATGFGGTGIHLKLPGLTQTRIVNCYMDFTGIVAEDPVQLLISDSFFLGDAYVMLKSVGQRNDPSEVRLSFEDRIRRMQEELKASSSVSPATSPSPEAQPGNSSPRVYRATSYGADPTGQTDSTEALLAALSDALRGPSNGFLMDGIANFGGARISLDGGSYLISRPLRFPSAGAGNLVIHGGTLRASDDFPTDEYLIDLTAPVASTASSSYNYEYITFRDLMLDSNYRGGGILVQDSLRTSIDNCYVARFSTEGISVHGGHETYIRNSFLGQHITAGGDHGERNFSGTAINLSGNDNAVTDVVIFSASVGIMVSGAANTISGVHFYNKATGFGGTGIYLKLPGLTQTRIVNCYMDFTGIVAEDPVQLLISDSFFLGDAYVVLKSIKGVINGVNIVNNMFSGSNKGIDVVQLDQSGGPFKDIGQVVVDQNNVKGMNLRSTVARGSTRGNGTSWMVDFSSALLFPDLISHVQYSLSTSTSGSFPNHCVRSTSRNRVVIESDVAVPASVFVTVDQGQL